MDLRLSFRDLEAADLSDLNWSGGPEHIRAVATALEASYAGEVALLVGCLPNDRLLAMGGVDFRPSEDAGSIWMLAVHERFQSLGIGTQLIAALEQKIIERLGYSETWPALDSWPVAGGKTYVTACTIMERKLHEIHGADAVPH
jgi:ribosomal protein S18 acetylase RimI-like enzyme